MSAAQSVCNNAAAHWVDCQERHQIRSLAMASLLLQPIEKSLVDFSTRIVQILTVKREVSFLQHTRHDAHADPRRLWRREHRAHEQKKRHFIVLWFWWTETSVNCGDVNFRGGQKKNWALTGWLATNTSTTNLGLTLMTSRHATS